MWLNIRGACTSTVRTHRHTHTNHQIQVLSALTSKYTDHYSGLSLIHDCLEPSHPPQFPNINKYSVSNEYTFNQPNSSIHHIFGKKNCSRLTRIYCTFPPDVCNGHAVCLYTHTHLCNSGGTMHSSPCPGV